MKSLEDSVVSAMDGGDKELFPFLPYILQDLWEIGADPEVMIQLIRKNFTDYEELKILDLGCGKGAVSVKAASVLGCSCYGIDAVPEFIAEARIKADEYDVKHLCKFEIGDIRESIKNISGYDVIILGSIGPVFGNYYETLTALSECITNGGIFIMDDGYIKTDSVYEHPAILNEKEILDQIKSAGMVLIDEYISGNDDIKNSNNFIFENLRKRCLELIDKYPGKRKMFADYIKIQSEENDVLENKVVCAAMVIKKGQVTLI